MRILVISDIHANYTAFEAVLRPLRRRMGIRLVFGRCGRLWTRPQRMRRPAKNLAAALPGRAIMIGLRWKRLDVRTFNPDARRAVQWTRETLTDENTRWLEALPVTFVIGEYTLVHASPREPIWEYILEPMIAALNFPHFETPFCFVGHTHQPVIYTLEAGRRECRIRRAAI